MDDERPDPRESVEGPGDTELAPAGNSDARLVVPKDQEGGEQESPEEGPPEGDDGSADSEGESGEG